jgi:hypothetical protein
VAELVGYRSFVPLPESGAAPVVGPVVGPVVSVVAGVHPDRVAPGRHPGRGVLLAGPVRSCRPSGAGWEASVETAGTLVPVRLREQPAAGQDFEFTVLDPPCFGPDGVRVSRPEEVPT